MRSTMNYQFQQVPQVAIPRSSFDRSHGYKTTFDADYLVPFYVDEALPGDTFNLQATLFARLLTPIVPVMDNIFIDTFFFAVPKRLVWTNFKRFMGEQSTPGDSISYSYPTVTGPNSGAGGVAIGSLADYMGIPTGIGSITWNNLAFRCYNLIWNEWFRDENLQNPVTVDLDDGPDTYSDYVLKKRGKRHDYFTSCLPWAQKGTAPTLGIGSTADVMGIGLYTPGASSGASNIKFSDDTTSSTGNGWYIEGNTAHTSASGESAVFIREGTSGYPNIYADLSSAAAITINTLRQSIQIQKLLERDARGGTRYVELIKSHYGVTSSDQRLQRPEYLGGQSVPLNIHQVPQTSATDTGTSSQSPQGNLAAFAAGTSHGSGFVKSFEEHCVILGLCNVRCDITYQQGLNRMYSRSTRYDEYWPVFAHLGEQAVLNKEIYMQGTGDDTNTFGYQERWAEYRYKPSQITGKFRSTASGTLDKWHLAQKFTSLPTLGDTFITSASPIDRIVAVTSQPQFQMDAFIKLKCARPMPLRSIPGNMDRF